MKTHIPRKVVCFGGGTGLPTLLRGLRNLWFEKITAVVTVFDNSARSRKLRDDLGVLPPSDIGRCLLALSPQEDVIRKFLFDNSNKETYSGMHILLSGGEQIFKNFHRSIEAAREILGVDSNHQVLPVTDETGVQLVAIATTGKMAEDEPGVDKLMESGEIIKSLYLRPPAKASNNVLDIISDADLLCVGPGSLYTSVLPNFLVGNIKDRIQRSTAPIFFIMNLLSEGLGMNDLTGKDIVKFSENYIGRPIDKIIINDGEPSDVNWLAYEAEGKKLAESWSLRDDFRCVSGQLWTSSEYARHNPRRLASLVYDTASRWHGDR